MQTVRAPEALKSRADEIKRLDTSECEIDFIPGSWQDKVPYAEVRDLVKDHPDGQITRQHLFALGRQAVAGDAGDRRRLLVGTLMWGYGPKGGRSYTNANRVLKVGGLDRKLDECATAIHDVNIRAAYRAIDGLSGYGSGYFTKYLYFLARELDWGDQAPKPLIFDSRVESTLVFIAKALNVRWGEYLIERRSAVARYLYYCETAQSWAADLGLPPGVEGAEKIEQYLFDPKTLWFDVHAEMRRLASAVLRDCADGSAGPHTRAARDTMNIDLAGSSE